MNNLIVAGAKVRVNKNDLYSLNDLHKAAGGLDKDKPSHWLANIQTKDLITEMESRNSKCRDSANKKVMESKIGRYGGTHVCKQLVYAYAMWISPKFHIHVIEAYDDLINGRIESIATQAKTAASRQRARLESRALTDAVKITRESQGKEIKAFHFSNEYDLINRVALGMTAKQYRSHHSLDKAAPIRDTLTLCEIECIEHLQRLNASLIDIGMDFDQRKVKLNQVYMQRHKRKLLDEIKRLES